MRLRAPALAAAAVTVLPAVALAAAKPVAYQGYTSQGHQIAFKKGSAGVLSMKIAVRASCVNDSGQNQGDYDFTIKATDTVADPVKSAKFTVKLPGNGAAPDATIKGTFNRRGTARGTITAVGKVKGGSGDLGTCKSPTVRWTAAP